MEESLQDQLCSILSTGTLHNVQDSKKKRVRCFKGAHNAQQEIPVMKALQLFLDDELLTVEYLLCKQVKDNRWSAAKVIDWLLDSHIHLIITHVHQNIVEHLGWNMVDLMYQLQRLYDHPGYPYRQLLRDPIFLQDKYEYIRIVEDICNPTFKITIRENNSYLMDDIQSILTFTGIHNDIANAWMMKLPFVSNGFHKSRVNSIDDIISKLEYYSNNFYGMYPYVMLQPYLTNKKEYKVAVFDGKPLYICKSTKRGSEKAFSNTTGRMKFAENAVSLLKGRSRNVCCEGLIRVDIMQGNDGSMIVNEFESLEACIWSTSDCVRNESVALAYSSTFWRNQILKFLEIEE